MIDIIESLYNEIYLPKVSPEELINNALLPNYISVNMKSNSIGLIVISTCVLENNLKAQYIYQFDKEKKLISLKESVNKTTNILYDRKSEINSKYEEILKQLNSVNISKVV